MRIFLTGSSGFIGSHLLPQLLAAGHEVCGLVRSPAAADALRALGALPQQGDITQLDSLRRGAERCDAVIHTAFNHDFSRFAENCANDALAIIAMGEALRGSNRPLLITSTTVMGLADGARFASEDHFDAGSRNPRVASERAGQQLLERGVNLSVMRLSQIHDTRRQGLVSDVIALAARTGVSAYVGQGDNRWSAAHVADTALLYRLAIEHAAPGACYHATAEPEVAFKAIAEAVAEALGLPVVALDTQQAAAHFGWLLPFVSRQMAASSEWTRQQLGWQPIGPGLLQDIALLQSFPD